MTLFEYVLLLVGIGMLTLGGVSGYSLFARAVRVSDRFGDETNVGTLWGLFLLGISAGLFLVWWALP